MSAATTKYVKFDARRISNAGALPSIIPGRPVVVFEGRCESRRKELGELHFLSRPVGLQTPHMR